MIDVPHVIAIAIAAYLLGFAAYPLHKKLKAERAERVAMNQVLKRLKSHVDDRPL